jgi:hypothetical protein
MIYGILGMAHPPEPPTELAIDYKHHSKMFIVFMSHSSLNTQEFNTTFDAEETRRFATVLGPIPPKYEPLEVQSKHSSKHLFFYKQKETE